jgi:Protein of unknown function (DUF2973)
MLHILYILAFTFIAFLAISNLIRSLITLSSESQNRYPRGVNSYNSNLANSQRGTGYYRSGVVHPELLDERGNPINEPLLVMRSVSVEDAREQLDALYNSSPSQVKETEEEA